MDLVSAFLSDDFAKISQLIAGLKSEITELEGNFKEAARQYKKERGELEEKVKQVIAEWEAKLKGGGQ